MAAGSMEAPRRQRFGVALASVAAVFAIQGIATPAAWQQLIVSALLGLTLLSALYETNARHVVIRAAAVLVVGVMLASVIASANGDVNGAASRVPDAVLVALTPPAIVIALVHTLRATRTVTVQMIFGVLAVYLLLGMLFANVYGSIDRLGGDPFFAEGQSATVAHCVYYSFVSLTTLGYGDFTARTSLGHTLSSFEALIGQIFLVTVVGLIVGNLKRAPRVA